MRRSRRWIRVLLVAVLAVVGLRAMLPLVVELALERVLSGLLAARLQIGDVDLDLQEGEVAIDDATLLAAATGAELAHAARLDLDADWGALVHGRLEAESASIDAPQLLLAYDAEGRFNWAGVLDRLSGKPAGKKEGDGATFRVKVDRAEVGEGVLRLIDDTSDGLPNVRVAVGAFALGELEVGRSEPAAPLRWGLGSAEMSSWQIGIAPDRGEPLDFELRAHTGALGPDGVLPVELELSGEHGGHLALQGDLRPETVDLSLRMSWEDIASKALLPFLAIEGMRVDGGRSEGELDIAFTLDEVPERGLTAHGHAVHRDLALVLEGDAPATLDVARVEVELEKLRFPIPAAPVDPPPPLLAHWSRIEILEPTFDVTLPHSHPVSTEAPREAPARTAGLDVRVDRLSVERGRVRWRDPELDEAHSATPIVLDARNLTWPRLGFRHLRLEAGGLGAEPLRVEGSWVGNRADVELRATRIALVPWNPLIESYSDYSVSHGELSLRSRFHLEGEEYEAPTRVTLHNLDARAEGNAFQKTFGMPLAAATRLLKDPAGTIRLNVPVRGNLTEGGHIDLVPAVADALRGSISNALVSTGAVPVDVTGSLLRHVGEIVFLGLGEAAFDAGDYELEADARLALDAAAPIARQKSGSRVELVSEVVSDDLKALGIEAGGGGVLGSALAVGRAILGGGRTVEGEAHARLAELTELRFEAIETYLGTKGLGPDRIIRKPWDGKVREGLPRVLLRLETRGE